VRRGRRVVMAEAVAVVAAVLVVKAGVHFAGGEVLELNSLFTSMIAGAIFLFGLILSGTLTDYKESERVPAELVASLESIRSEVHATVAKNPAYDAGPALEVLSQIPSRLRAAIDTGDYGPLHESISALTPVFAAMEAGGALPQYVSRIRADQANCRRLVLRVAHVQRIDFLPSAYQLLLTTVTLVVGILVFTRIEPLYLSFVLVSFVTFLFVYMLRLLRVLETPFRPEGETRDDVSLFLLHEFAARVEADRSSAVRGEQDAGVY
jgi:hypothetical protein